MSCSTSCARQQPLMDVRTAYHPPVNYSGTHVRKSNGMMHVSSTNAGHAYHCTTTRCPDPFQSKPVELTKDRTDMQCVNVDKQITRSEMMLAYPKTANPMPYTRPTRPNIIQCRPVNRPMSEYRDCNRGETPFETRMVNHAVHPDYKAATVRHAAIVDTGDFVTQVQLQQEPHRANERPPPQGHVPRYHDVHHMGMHLATQAKQPGNQTCAARHIGWETHKNRQVFRN